MIARLELSDEETAQVMREAAKIAAEQMLAEALLTRENAAKMLGVTTKTLNLLPVKRVKVGGSTRYRMADLKAYVESCLE